MNSKSRTESANELEIIYDADYDADGIADDADDANYDADRIAFGCQPRD